MSNIGTWMETVAFGIYVTNRTGQAVWPGLVAAATFVPTAFIGPVGGAVADRMPRKVVLLITTVGADVLRRPHHDADDHRQSRADRRRARRVRQRLRGRDRASPRIRR